MPNICDWCGEIVELGEDSEACANRSMHKECAFRAVAGSVAHIRRRCSCFGGTEHDPPGMTKRQAAKTALDVYQFYNGPK